MINYKKMGSNRQKPALEEVLEFFGSLSGLGLGLV